MDADRPAGHALELVGSSCCLSSSRALAQRQGFPTTGAVRPEPTVYIAAGRAPAGSRAGHQRAGRLMPSREGPLCILTCQQQDMPCAQAPSSKMAVLHMH